MKIALVFMALLVLPSCMENYSNGERTGTVTKLSHKGLVFKSWEGELLQGGLRKTTEGRSEANVFQFNAAPHTVAALKQALNSGEVVTVTYYQWFFPPPTIENDQVVD